ncbi:PEPxxWA-CTERM sorting domain-containing protein [Sphingomonas tabacisoli]|uniref:PEPxxWA-CTERM sorting domain-containing protein n=1 Tax=Sphingomonas tabacisoli TaxID=2249466 RepID=A0ABW4I3K7_9SPHN
MEMGKLAAVAFALLATPAMAAPTTLKLVGTVTQQQNPGTDPNFALGDTVTVTFNYDPATQPVDPFHGTGRLWFNRFTPASVFSIDTSRGLQWTAIYETQDEGVFLDPANPLSFSGHFSKLTSSLPDIILKGDGSFSIPGLSQSGARSLGFAGTLAVAGVPEPASWALMIGGFAAAGGAIRRKRSGSTAQLTVTTARQI